MYDCDQAALAKEGNFYTFFNNTVVHQSHLGGQDVTGAVVCLADTGTVEGAGAYLEGNLLYDVEQLVRNQTNALVTFTNNLMSLDWNGPGGGNINADPLFVHTPALAETTNFTTWEEAQVMWDWFRLQPGSPARAAGPGGRDLGAVIPRGVAVSGVPSGTTSVTAVTLEIGVNRTGHGIPTAGWPEGTGYTRYRWRLDSGDWSAETPLAEPLILTNLSLGDHVVEVTGRRDSGLYQDDPIFGAEATAPWSGSWTVITQGVLRVQAAAFDTNVFRLAVGTEAGRTYTVWRTDSLTPPDWQRLADLPGDAVDAVQEVVDPDAAAASQRFYRVVTPAQP